MIQNTTTSNLVLDRIAYPFQVGSAYHHKDVFRIIGLPSEPTGGNWFTGYNAIGDDWFIFCGFGTGGRTAHDYGNYFNGDRLFWYVKTNTNLQRPSIQKLIEPTGNIYIFFREEDRDPFIFAGMGTAAEVFDESSVKINWRFHGGKGSLPFRNLSEGTTQSLLNMEECAGYERLVLVRFAAFSVSGEALKLGFRGGGLVED